MSLLPRLFLPLATLTAFAALAVNGSRATPAPAPGLSSSSSAPSANQKIAPASPGWILEQKSQVCGYMQVYVTATAIKAVDSKTSTTLISKAPDWQVVVFNKSNKTVYTSPFDKFIGYGVTGLQVQMGFKHGGIPVSKKNLKATVAGLPANVYGTTPEYEKRGIEQYQRKQVTSGMPRSARTLTSSGWSLPKQPANILCRLYGLGDTPDVPLEFHCIDQDGLDDTGLSTKSAKKATIASKEFDIPGGYTRVPTMEAVRIDASGQTAMEDMLQGLDDGIGKMGKGKAQTGGSKTR